MLFDVMHSPVWVEWCAHLQHLLVHPR